jgi:DNA invertase Pin-like site-specific DNA recombinase
LRRSPIFDTLPGVTTTLGYARVSTSHQTLDQQTDALTAAGCERIFTDKMSGTRDDRPGLSALLDYARDGDTVVVLSLDRLGRSLAGIIKTVATLHERGILLRSIREQIDYSTPTGRMVAAIFAVLAEYERELINERAAAAREAARARGKHTGRPKALTAEQVQFVSRMRQNGESIPTIMQTLGVSRSTVYRALA